MQSTELEVLQAALKGLQQGFDVTLVSVVKTYGTSPRPVGSLLTVCSDGSFCGSVSGGCIEDDLLQRLVEHPPRSVEMAVYGETEKERHHFGLPCGGSLALLLEPLTGCDSDIEALIEAISSRRTVTRTLMLPDSAASASAMSVSTVSLSVTSASATSLAPASVKPASVTETTSEKALPADHRSASLRAWQPDDKPELQGKVWQNVFGPVWRLLIIGAGQTSRYLAEMANALGYRILICDPRPQYRESWSVDATEFIAGYPDDAVRALQPDERTAIVALTHDPKLDDLALLEALKSPAFYVGALGSFNTNQNRRRRLLEHFDFTEEQVGLLRGPVGLPIGSKTPPEIALAVLAELTALRNGIDINAQLSAGGNT